jgi:hypothetical protein
MSTIRKLAEYMFLFLKALLWLLDWVALFGLGAILALTLSTRNRRLVLATCVGYLVLWTGFRRHQQHRVGY